MSCDLKKELLQHCHTVVEELNDQFVTQIAYGGTLKTIMDKYKKAVRRNCLK